MLSRYFILLIASIYLKNAASSILQNDSYNISNIIANNAGRFQKGLNQISANRGTNFQHSMNYLRGSNLPQNQHAQHALNTPSTTPGLSIPSVNQHSGLHSPLNANQPKGIQHWNTNDHEINGHNFEHNNPVQHHQLIQHSPGISSADLSQNPAMLPQMLPNSISDHMLSQALIQELHSHGLSNNHNSINDVNSIMYQHQQPASEVPSFILDRSHSGFPQYDPSYNGLASQRSGYSAAFSQPEIVPQHAMINSVIPSHLPNLPIANNHYVNSISSVASHSPAYTSNPQHMSSNAYKQESSSPSLHSLLPLILNLLQDNNDYECCKQCPCSNMKNTQQGSQPATKGYFKNGGCGCKHDVSLGKSTVSGNIERYNTKNSGSRNVRNQVKAKNVKIEESYEDYDDDDVGEADYD